MADRFKQHGAFSWNELMTTDPNAAKEFYGKLFKWELMDMPMEEMTYTVAKAGEDDVAGIMQIPPDDEGAPPSWGAYVTVDNVDQTVRLAEELGGRIVVPARDVPEVGRFAVIQDPQGAMISIITYTTQN